LQVAVESCIAIGNYIISSEKYRAPEDYADIFRVLAENKIIPDDFMLEMQKMTRFRNRIVHIYWDIEDAFIYDLVHTHLTDFDKFIGYISQLIDISLQ